MAFAGAAVVTSLGRNAVRLTGVSLLAGTSGIIGLNGDAGADVQLPVNFPSTPDAAAVQTRQAFSKSSSSIFTRW